MRSDGPIASYVSGGIDSSLVAILANDYDNFSQQYYHGRFLQYSGFDESHYAQKICDQINGVLNIDSYNHNDFIQNIEKVIYFLDTPVAGPGALPQYMISQTVSQDSKVVLGGQGGDEMFGGYARYVIAYFEQCIKASLNDNYKNGNFIVTIESIIPNLNMLKEYQPLIKEFWREGVFENLDERYFRLINRSNDIGDDIDWQQLDITSVKEKFKTIFNNHDNVEHNSYFDKMTHFDFKCQLPALLHIEDRMSMAHGLESRIPFLDHELIEFSATIPANIKFQHGRMKHLLKTAYRDLLPDDIINRRDKMGFPVPLNLWLKNELKDFYADIMSTIGKRPYFNSENTRKSFTLNSNYSRKSWAMISLELWYRHFHDKQTYYKSLIK